jgi:hypothetical protein
LKNVEWEDALDLTKGCRHLCKQFVPPGQFRKGWRSWEIAVLQELPDPWKALSLFISHLSSPISWSFKDGRRDGFGKMWRD